MNEGRISLIKQKQYFIRVMKSIITSLDSLDDVWHHLDGFSRASARAARVAAYPAAS